MPDQYVIGSYFNGHKDWQRDQVWQADYAPLAPLVDSIKGDWKVAIIHDCLTGIPKPIDKVDFHEVSKALFSANWYRWPNQLAYLRNNPHIKWVWLVDSTDVEMVHDPIKHMEHGKLYFGSEAKKVNDPWMMAFHDSYPTNKFLEEYKDYQLLNDGVIGGDRETVIGFLEKVVSLFWEVYSLHRAGRPVNISSDMGIFNMVARKEYQSQLVYGSHVTTLFGGWEPIEQATAWWKHK